MFISEPILFYQRSNPPFGVVPVPPYNSIPQHNLKQLLFYFETRSFDFSAILFSKEDIVVSSYCYRETISQVEEKNAKSSIVFLGDGGENSLLNIIIKSRIISNYKEF